MNTETNNPTDKKRILLVDDQVQNTELLRLFLEQNNFAVKAENDSAAALEVAEKFKPHLILLDVMMPKMDGGELAALFQGSPTLKDVPIIYLTAAITREEVARNRERQGQIPFLAKPVILAEVLDCINRKLSA